ncbi:SMI1/KNR4 family protein [Dactylosporangium aurantiacum]|uniref:SMI1/KNR4 family protein n=1 Tax=Dactylosporangium aurantiacum TaxID=35754 RepID=A0A9Q9INJ2_9ACTN|nr:SMI1/KNR4 family protein [Dactylosporangium aurantiacum]MDG6105645.1 SMI1/KNR4 family protein [Dactylosporangium aurantiacum]UWZ57022.1 SMI1/KNR4 family protein [Dactylosporangium aurantiacum]
MPEQDHDDGGRAGTVVLWRAVGQAELDLVAAAGWRAWPAGPGFAAVPERRRAAQLSRERFVPADGVGYVVRFEVERAYLERFAAHREHGYVIPAKEIAGLNAHLVGAITEEADYRGPVSDREFAEAERALGRPLPAVWRSYLQGASWFRRGWLASGAYVWLNPPREMLRLHEAWDGGTAAHPGIAVIGGDGAREHLALDLRGDPAPVLLVDITSAGWESGIRQADDVGAFIRRVEDGGFEFEFGDG